MGKIIATMLLYFGIPLKGGGDLGIGSLQAKYLVLCFFYGDSLKGALSWYGKLTWESAHTWNLIILCLLIVWGMTFIFMVHLSFYAIPLLIYDVMYDITTIP